MFAKHLQDKLFLAKFCSLQKNLNYLIKQLQLAERGENVLKTTIINDIHEN